MRYLQTVNNWEVGMNGSKKPNLREFRHDDKRKRINTFASKNRCKPFLFLNYFFIFRKALGIL